MPWSPSLPQLLPSPHFRRSDHTMHSDSDPLPYASLYSKPSVRPSLRTATRNATTTSTFHLRVPVNVLTTSPTSERCHFAWKQHVSSSPSPSPPTHPFDDEVNEKRHHQQQEQKTEPVSIPKLREAINKIDSKVALLMTQRKELQTHLDQAVRSQTPVLRLPDELLSSIFVIGVRTTEEEDPLMVSCLMLVCRHWAEVAINTPVLWSKIAVGNHDSLNKAHRKLFRSKSVPLDLTINFSPRPEYTGRVTENVIHAMDLFRPALWRTRSFRLSVPTRVQAHAALLRCQEDAPLLEFVSIRVFHSIQDDHYSQPRLPLFNGCTPRLRSCSFTSFNFGWDIRTVSRLRVLKLGGYFNGLSPSIDTLLAILHECPDLEEFAIRDMSDIDLDDCMSPDEEDRMPTRRTMIPLHRLTKASFHCTGLLMSRLILAQLSFPALRTLEFCYLNNITPILHQLETQAFTCLPLRHLRIESCLFNELKLVQLLRRLPSLITLELVDTEDVSSGLLRSLSKPPAGQPWVCPNLETLGLDGCTSLESDALRTLIESRLPAHSHAYPRSQQPFSASAYAQGGPRASTSASAYARSQAIRAVPAAAAHVLPHGTPRRLRVVDVTRCHQISKEMVQWLRMYVADVRCEPANGVWGEPVLP